MNREIKFRCFEDGRMFYSDNQEDAKTLGCKLGGSMIATFFNQFYGHPNLMQYTGLKDKNGKEIYEGDIVRWRVNDIERTGPVYYDELQASFWIGKDIKTNELVLNDWMRGEHEIIGNIHSNPELLS